MYNRGWNKLIKSNDNRKYELRAGVEKKHCSATLSFTQLAFDHDEESLVVVDTKGNLYCIDLSEDAPMYKRLGKIGQATFLAFNPRYRGEILIGYNAGDIKIWRLHANLDEFSLLSGHKLPPTCISFYKSHCLTHSRNEVIIWYLQSYSKTHQLKVDTKNAVIRKAIFSNAGHIVVLYNNDTMQAWTFKQLDKDTKIDIKIFGGHHIKDFIFTKDGRAMIIVGAKGICILNTYDWSLLRKLSLLDNFIEARQLSVVPRPLDGGANKIVALLSSRCTLHFCDINLSSPFEIADAINRVKKFVISSAGRYIAYLDQEGCLNVMHIDKVISKKSPQPKKLLDRPQAHKINDHLEYIRQSVKQELDIKRLISILTEFGEYPKQYRALIWSTILKLPANRNAYLALVNKVTRERFTWNTLRDYSVADKSKASLLAMTINCLVQWCPLLLQSSFLPNLVFPFLMVFQKDPLLAFELILSILLNYCHNWFEYHPLPPLNILGIIENILLEADPQLLNIFCEHGVTTSEYAWPLLQTAMSEVLSGDEWLILWDHLITFQKPRLLLMCVVAYSIYSRENIISLIQSSGNCREDMKEFYSTQGHVRAKDLLKIARKLDQEMPEQVHSYRYLRSKVLQLTHTGPYPLFMLKEYPKFLIENFCTTDLKKWKAEQHSQNCDHGVAESGQKTDTFAKQTYETRLNVQKCFLEHKNKKSCCQHLHKDSSSQLRETQALVKYKSAKDETLNFKDNTPKNYEKLRRDVTKLEYEVLSFLDLLKSDRSRVNII
ncbi:TBC1 domain family member 31 isoform X2 [Odontomachus brunneus]|uniref:TBC1 domain family member 31 isoform X2 n=1 Tax=Odontomachus brunneus TaxID=486640 RepID=UPI0013F2A9D9|nr:TBC1 domain family member 31 isoform X2 [Odontomachus brunneus]